MKKQHEEAIRKKSKTVHNSKTDEDDLSIFIPSEIILNILSRLPIRTITRCKCVCKSWLDLIATPEFVKSHLSRSVPGLAVCKRDICSMPYKIIGFVDMVDINSCDHHLNNMTFNLDLPFHEQVHSSVNGLLFLDKDAGFPHHRDLFLCNPVTREYIKLPSPPQPSPKITPWEAYGFGLSRRSCQYKVVRIFIRKPRELIECQVYTVGTGTWRSVSYGNATPLHMYAVGEFLNGNLHWTIHSDYHIKEISCLNLETEAFSTFSVPSLDDRKSYWKLCVLGDRLCVCDIPRYNAHDIDIWLMKEYGDEKSWTKEFVIREAIGRHNPLGFLPPVKVFKDGDILVLNTISKLLYYSSKANTIRYVDDVFGLVEGNSSSLRSAIIFFAPSFLSLKNFAMENVTSF